MSHIEGKRLCALATPPRLEFLELLPTGSAPSPVVPTVELAPMTYRRIKAIAGVATPWTQAVETV